MGNGVGTTFTVQAKGTTDRGDVFIEEISFEGGKPTLRLLRHEIQLRLHQLHGTAAWPFRISGLRVECEEGRWEVLKDTNHLRDNEIIRVVRAGEELSPRRITNTTLKQKAKAVFRHMDSHHKGYIDSTDAKNVLGSGRCMNSRMRISSANIYDWFLEADTSRTGRINWRAWARFSQNHSDVIELLYSHIQSWKHHLTIENTVPHYMVSTVADRCRSGQVVVDAVAPVPNYVSYSQTIPQRRGYDSSMKSRRVSTIPPAPPQPDVGHRNFHQQLDYNSPRDRSRRLTDDDYEHQSTVPYVPPAPPQPVVDQFEYNPLPHDESHLFQHEIRRSPPRHAYDEYYH